MGNKVTTLGFYIIYSTEINFKKSQILFSLIYFFLNQIIFSFSKSVVLSS